MIKIDKGVPLPNPERGTVKFPFNDLKVGESFFVANTSPEFKKLVNGFTNYVRFLHGRKFTRRTLTEGDTRGIRIWRIK